MCHDVEKLSNPWEQLSTVGTVLVASVQVGSAREHLSAVGTALGSKCPGKKCPGATVRGSKCPGSKCPGSICPVTPKSRNHSLSKTIEDSNR